jgi:hypothetical protein
VQVTYDFLHYAAPFLQIFFGRIIRIQFEMAVSGLKQAFLFQTGSMRTLRHTYPNDCL